MRSRGNRPELPTRAVEIEHAARSIHVDLWKSQQLGGRPNPLELLKPGVALTRKGYQVKTVETLGTIYSRGNRAEVAGELNRPEQIVRISSRFSIPEQFFTTAHELGHVVLNHCGDTIHRDRPMDPLLWDKDPQEREADYFAACFLMPEKQVVEWFNKLFLTGRFELNDDTAFALCPKSPDEVINRRRTLRDLSLCLSGITSYGGRPIQSLVELFGVSHSSMAIRLEQLDLVAEPRLGRRRN